MARSAYDPLPLGQDLAGELADLPCRSGDADLWFAAHPAAIDRAKTLCRACPLREACLTQALERHEPWGVWGGELVVDGVVISHKRPRGRPRKDARPLAS
ncbi:WhiB family transcriptional regulator [Nocardioides sp. AN3]